MMMMMIIFARVVPKKHLNYIWRIGFVCRGITVALKFYLKKKQKHCVVCFDTFYLNQKNVNSCVWVFYLVATLSYAALMNMSISNLMSFHPFRMLLFM